MSQTAPLILTRSPQRRPLFTRLGARHQADVHLPEVRQPPTGELVGTTSTLVALVLSLSTVARIVATRFTVR